MSDDEEPVGFWRTVPGILTGVAAVLTALTGLFLAFNPPGGGGKKDLSGLAAATGADSDRADVLAGTWAGEARDDNGATFSVVVALSKPCRVGKECGAIRVSDKPCQGHLVLDKVAPANEFEFRVRDFFADTNRSLCNEGPGEWLTWHSDTLGYRGDYPPNPKATLMRLTDEEAK